MSTLQVVLNSRPKFMKLQISDTEVSNVTVILDLDIVT